MNRDLVHQLLPPALFKLVRRVRSRARPLVTGNYATFADAADACGEGYQSASIIESTVERFRKAHREHATDADGTTAARDAASQRPAVELSEGDLRFLSSVAAPLACRRRSDRFRVIDFGGQVGAHYLSARRLLPPEVQLDWTVVETQATAAAGDRHFARRGLRFTADLADAPRDEVDLIYSSGTLNHVPEPLQSIRDLAARDVSWMVLDRLSLTDWARERIAIQPTHYNGLRAAYPFRIMREADVVDAARDAGFEPTLTWTLRDHEMLIDGQSVWFRGIQFARRVQR